MRILIFTFAAIMLLFATGPYLSVAILRVTGDSAAAVIEQDGSVMTMVNGPNAPQPQWLKLVPASIIASATRWQPNKYAKDGGLVDLVSRKSRAEIKAHYSTSLRSEGFGVEDMGFGPLNAGSASFLGIEAFIIAEHADRKLEASIKIGEEDWITGARVIQISWRERWPDQPSALDAFRKASHSAAAQTRPPQK